MANAMIVVPCYDEAEHFCGERFAAFLAEQPTARLLFVDDGSRDATLRIFNDFAFAHKDRVFVRDKSPNEGKAEAVQRGVLAAAAHGPDFVGYWDADLVMRLDEHPRFIEVFEQHPDLLMVKGSRVQLLGRHIDRNSLRHYLGRVAATFVSLALRLPVYDTQAGAKLPCWTPAVVGFFHEPFATGWVFDVELIARIQRLQCDPEAKLPPVDELIDEIPRSCWSDVTGLKIRPLDLLRSFVDIWKIYCAIPATHPNWPPLRLAAKVAQTRHPEGHQHGERPSREAQPRYGQKRVEGWERSPFHRTAGSGTYRRLRRRTESRLPARRSTHWRRARAMQELSRAIASQTLSPRYAGVETPCR